MPEKLGCRYIKRYISICSILILMFGLSASSSRAQYLVADGHFNGGGGIRDGTANRVLDSAGAISGTDRTTSAGNGVISGFWHHFVTTSPLEVAVTAFSCGIRDYSVVLRWNLSADSEINGIHVMRGEEGEQMLRITDELLSASAISYTDKTALPGRTYIYQLEVMQPEGNMTQSFTVRAALPTKPLTLYQNYPNPFNPATRISFYLPENASVRLAIYDVEGRMVKEVLSENYREGKHTAVWNGTDSEGENVSSGVYFYILSAGKSRLTRKLVLMR